MEKVFFLLALAFAYANAVPLEQKVSEDRMINGLPAADRQFPYAVSIQLNPALAGNVETRGHHCGGVLVTLQHVVSTGSCTFIIGNMNIPIPILAQNYRVFAGASRLTNDTSGDRIRQIANYIVHPQYIAPPSHVNDIAVFILSSPFLNTTVIPLSLPSTNFRPNDFTLCTVAGWGAAYYNSFVTSVQLMYATKYVYNQDQCTSVYNGAAFQPNVFPTMVCAGPKDITTSNCWGDLGNALVCDGTLTGILFMTNCQSDSFPELYTRVSNYTTWIRSITTSSASAFNPGVFTLVLFAVLHVVFQKIIV